MFRYPQVFRAVRGSAGTLVPATLLGFFIPFAGLLLLAGFAGVSAVFPHMPLVDFHLDQFLSRDRPSDTVTRIGEALRHRLRSPTFANRKNNGRSRKSTSASGFRPCVQSVSRHHQQSRRADPALGFASLRHSDARGLVKHHGCAHAISKPRMGRQPPETAFAANSYPLVGFGQLL